MKYYIKTFKDGNCIDSVIHRINKGEKTQLDYLGMGLTYSIENKFPFFALIELRLELEKLNIKLFCNGSRIDVYPSGMSAMGVMAYELKLGKPAKKLVNIFDPTDKIEMISTVSEQKLFREKWLESIISTR